MQSLESPVGTGSPPVIRAAASTDWQQQAEPVPHPLSHLDFSQVHQEGVPGRAPECGGLGIGWRCRLAKGSLPQAPSPHSHAASKQVQEGKISPCALLLLCPNLGTGMGKPRPFAGPYSQA